jgi:myo-inositol 2-dehydrogenase / D-chiro-inositol 1-dehydrogenase
MSERSSNVPVALVGCGSIASAVHLRILRRLPGMKLVGVADPAEDARARAERIGRVEAVADPAELIARDGVEAVVVCAPTAQHAELGTLALDRGRHLYLEKPIATSAREASALAAARERAGVVGMVGFNHRFHPLHERARELVRGDTIGAVREVHTSFCNPPSELPAWKRSRATGGGVLLDLASHQIDLVRWLLADEVAGVRATVSSLESEDDTARLELRTTGGAEVSGFFSSCSARCAELLLIGERGTLRVDRYAPRLELSRVRGPSGVRRKHLPATVLAPWQLRKRLRPGYEPSYRRSLQAFAAAVRGGSAEVPTIEDGVRSLEVVLASERSARQDGAPVDLAGTR